MSHRLAWLYIYGKWPNIIDHINGVKDDNRIENLRDVTTRVNGQNSERHRNGKKVGTSFEKKSNRWRATFTEKDNKRFFIGMFDTEQEASDAYFDVINNPANRYKYRDKRFSKQRERDLIQALEWIKKLDNNPFNHHEDAARCAICHAIDALKKLRGENET